MTDIYFLFLMASFVIFIAGIAVGIYVFISKLKQKELYEENAALQAKFTKALLQTQVEIQEQTLKNIGLEMHDNIGQILTLVKLHVTHAQTMDDESPTKLKNAEEEIIKAIQALRNISKSLDSDYISKHGFITALENWVGIIKKSGKQFSLSVEGDEVNIEDKKQLILFRIIQESINNIIKHSEASKALISIVFEKSVLQIKIIDDGIGFDINTVVKGQGLNNLFSRATLINATIHIDSGVGKGTTVYVNLQL